MLMFSDDKNLDGFKMHNIYQEVNRRYHYPDGVVYTIYGPETLYVKESDPDSHRVIDSAGVAHIPSKGWLAISFDKSGLEF